MGLRIGIITFHAAWNYGAILQCTALTKKLQSEGHSVYVIDYRPSYAKENIVRNPLKEAIDLYQELTDKSAFYRTLRALRRSIRCVLDWRKIPKVNSKKKKFEEFQRTHLKLTRRYNTLEQLKKDPPDMDVYICGSDQLWNPSLTNGKLDPAYFLDFGGKEVKRLAYAVSACNINNEIAEQCILQLKNLNYISLREKKNQRMFEIIVGRDVSIMPDPTQLLSSVTYGAMEQTYRIQKPYIFIYLLSKDEATDQCNALVRKLIKSKEVVIVDASPNKSCTASNIKKIDYLAPGEWLYLIHHADCVVTNSFHCLSFATIYQKEMYILPCNSNRMERLEEFAEVNGLSERIVYTSEDVDRALDKKIDYLMMKSGIERARQNANDFFLAAFSSGQVHENTYEAG